MARVRAFTPQALVLVCLIVGLFRVDSLVAQTTTGLPPFSTIQGSVYDDVKINDGAVLLKLPVWSKAGLIPFSYSLTLNSVVTFNSIGMPSTNPNWSPQTSVGVTPAFVANWTPPAQSLNCSKGTTLKFTNYTITDGYGTVHPVPGMQYDTLQCYTQVLSGSTIDGSGYSVTVGSNGFSPVVYDSAGNKLTAGSLTDPNNNVMSYSEVCVPSSCPSTGYNLIITYTDTTLHTPMTETQTWATENSLLTLTQDVHSWTDAAGNARSYTINYSPYTHVTNFSCGTNYTSGTWYMPSTITTPDGTYTITYETTSGGYTGRIAKIVYPSGASLAYTYTGGSNNSGLTCGSGTAVMVPILTRTLTDTTGAQHTWKYDTTQAANETVVTDPAGNDTVYLFYTYTGTGGAIKGEYETQRQIYQGSHTSGTLLKTVLTCYNTNTTNCPNPSSLVPPFTQKDVYTTLSGMTQSSHSETKYNNVGNLTEDTEYDFTGTLISDRVITYGTYSNGTCTNPIGTHILNRVCTDLTQVGTTPVSQTNNSYDSYGNLLSSSHWARGSTGSGGTYLTSSSTYNSNGTVNVATDVNGAQTTYGNYTCNGNFPTGISEPLSLSRSMTWDCVGGVVTSITDENSQKTTYGYVNPTTGLADPYYRPLSVTDPLNNVTNYTYSPTTFEAAMNFNGTVSTSDSLTTTDGFGHMLFAQTRKGQGSTTPFDTTQYTYDSDFRLYSTSIPCVAAAGSPCSTAVTTSTYDGLSRPHVTQDGGGGTATTTYPQNDVLTVLGPPPAAEDAKSHQYEYDGIGRLTSVCEILTTGGTSCGQNTSASGYKTSYAYSVPAAGGSQMVVNQGTQTRTYVYDGLSRLISETNPESGTTNYTYDSGASSACTAGYSSAGDLLQKIDANGNSTCYYYDSLHRVTDETTNQSGGYCRRFRYDNTTGVTGTIPSGITISNSLTRVAEAETDNCSLPITPITDEWFSYSVRGENTDVYESTPHSGSPYYHTTASYWANGALESLTGVPGYTGLSYGVDGEGRLNTAQQGTSKIVCDTVPCGIASTTFDPAGNPLVVNIGGTADNDTYVYDPNTERMTSYTFTVGSTPASIAGALNWNQNGTLRQLAITDGFNSGGAQTCNYGTASPPVMGYDDLGRLLNVSCGSLWAQAFSYDQFGNISKTGSLTWACPTCYNGNNQYNSTLSASVSYDSDGNLLNDTFHKYTWDVYGHPSTIGGATGSITCGTSGTCLTYDANGHMVEKNVSGVFTEILYSPVGKTATMSGQSTTDAYFSLPAGETLYETGSTGGNRFFWHKD